MAVPVEGIHERAEAWKDWLGEPLVGLLVIFFGTNFVAFLDVLIIHLVQLLVSGNAQYLDIRDLPQFLLQTLDILFISHGVRDLFQSRP